MYITDIVIDVKALIALCVIEERIRRHVACVRWKKHPWMLMSGLMTDLMALWIAVS